jgi:glycosyltransferase involved in cell wall biosynthesis
MADQDGLTVMLLAPASSVHTRRWASALAGAGHRVIVASWQLGQPMRDVDVRIAPAPGASAARRVPLAVRWLRGLIAEARPDVVHVHSLGAHGLLSLALPGGPARVVTPWGSELPAARYSAVRGAVLFLALRRADLVLTTSAAVAGELMSDYAVPQARIGVLSWGVAQERIAARPSISPGPVRAALGIPADATVVLSVRSTAATYRTLEIVSAFIRAAGDRPELFLVLLGGHRPDRESARRAADGYLGRVRDSASTIRDRLLIVEHALSPEATFELMCASDIAVSIPPGDQRSSSVLEAALAGCRLVLSDIAPYHEMISDGLAADLLPEPVTSSLAEHLRRVSADEATGRRNQQFILTREHGAIKAAVLEDIYRRLSART